MCGIYGICKFRIDEHNFIKELNKMQHRGPDGFGVWKSREGEIMLGHRRLAIIDTASRSDQPMSFDGRHVIVFNGEIYNYIELRKSLESEGIVFFTKSDTEVLLKLIIHKGTAALSLLNGMWSFVIYDALEKSFFISRDRIGKKPFYYVHDGDRFAFSSEMKNLLCYLDNVEYDKEFIDFSVNNMFQSEVSEKTIFKGIKKFPSGCYAIFKDGQLQITRYYFPDQLLLQKTNHRSFEEATQQLNELFHSSCKLRMRSDVPAGSALSGGIDSGFVISTLAQLGFAKNGSYKALISSFPGSHLDETADALCTAKNAGVAAEPIAVNPDINPDHILKAVYDFEEISGTSPIPFFQLYQAFRQRNVVVTLDGHGADELFGGYTFDLYSKLKDDFPNLFEMRDTLHSINKMYGFNNDIRLQDAWPHFKGELLKKIKAKKILSVFEKEQYFKATLLQSTFYGILPTLLRNYDKYSMAAGVEIRMPFLDYRIIEFAFTLPNKYKLRGGLSKAIVRNAAKRIVPEKILSNKIKTGWNSPMGEWFAGPWKEWLFDEVASQGFRNCDLIDQTKIQNNIKKFYDNGQDHNSGQDLWIQLQPYLIEKANLNFG
jgi:asparagine synthase (glutamine-hydrolysing)